MDEDATAGAIWDNAADATETKDYNKDSAPGYEVKLQLSSSIKKWGMDEDATAGAIWENAAEGAAETKDLTK